jgi:hypothetical protein
MVRLGRENDIVGVLTEQKDRAWWTLAVVWSSNPYYPVRGFLLAVHSDQLTPLSLEPSGENFILKQETL